MRFLKLASAKNPDNDFILLNGGYYDKDAKKNNNFNSFSGLLCTSFKSIGINRELEFLKIKNRRFSVDNQTRFNKYTLTIEILANYSEYEVKHRQLLSFFDKNKKNGFRLYFKPYDNVDLRYCLCDVSSVSVNGKGQPVSLVLEQNSLWYGEIKNAMTSAIEEQEGNLFEFGEDDKISNYYSVKFIEDDKINNYYCTAFSNIIETQANIINNSYNEIPLNFKIYGECLNPTVSLYKKGEEEPIKVLKIEKNIGDGYYVEVNANVLENGVWLVNKSTGEKIDYIEFVNNEYGSPYFYVDNGEYYIKVVDEGQHACETEVIYKEEFNE